MAKATDISSLSSEIKFTLTSDNGFLGLNKIDPKARLHVHDGKILISGGSGGMFVMSYASGTHGYIEWRNGGLLTSTRTAYLGKPYSGNKDLEIYNEETGGNIVLQPDGLAAGLASSGFIELRSKVKAWKYQQHWSVTSISTATRWLNDFSGSTSASAFTYPAWTYDTWISVVHSNSATVQCYIEVELGEGTGNYGTLARSAPGGYDSCQSMVPAGCRWRIKYECTSGSGGVVTVYIFKMGR